MFYGGWVAGGGYSKGSGVPLRDRVRGAPPRVSEPPACPARHCWVTVPVDGARPRPGLLLKWRKVDHRWEGRVVYVAELRPGRWAAVEEWIPAELLSTG